MKIFITGIVLLTVWCSVSSWLYNDKLLPAMKKPVPMQTIAEIQTHYADSLIRLKASVPMNFFIYFEFDKTKFKPDQQTEKSVAEFKSWLEKYPQSMLLVTGHTDLVGTIDYNNSLAQKRAQIIEMYLENLGVNTSRIVVVSKGETEPAADYLHQEERARNRRTEISLKMQ
jgi:outer membrane protein OmpA-like peptidoglycan-associated protein